MSRLPALIVFLPLIGSVATYILGRSAPQRARGTALTVVLLTLLSTIPVVLKPPGQRALAWSWLERPAIHFALGVDGLSVWLVGLTALLMVTAVLVSWEAIRERVAAYYALLLLLESAMLGAFMAMDVIVFYVLFEFTLIPLFFIIGLWGGSERRAAARKFFIYTLAGSVLTFLGLIYLVIANTDPEMGSGTLTFAIPDILDHLQLPSSVQHWVFLALFAGFAIKVPLFPLHTWLPLAHVEAPTAGSVLLAGVLLKLGAYGFVRFSLPLLPDASLTFVPLMAGLSIIGIVYGSLVALAQQDLKRLVAYSSVSHMGFCMLGFFTLNAVGISGGILQMISHGLATGALFALVGMIYERYHSRKIDDYHGLARRLPLLTFFFVLMALSSLGLPGLAGFAGEVLVLLGTYRENYFYASVAALGIVLGAWYLLWLVERVFFGPLQEPHADTAEAGSKPPIPDLKPREIAALAPLAVFILWMGIFPQVFLRPLQPEVERIVACVEEAEKSRRASEVAGQRAARSRRPRTEQLSRKFATESPVTRESELHQQRLMRQPAPQPMPSKGGAR